MKWPFYTADKGTWLDFGQISSLEELEIGMQVKLLVNDTNPKGGVPKGNYIIPSGETFVFDKKGILIEIIPPSQSGVLFEKKFRVPAAQLRG